MSSKIIGSALLIAGTCIGAVMLVMPLTLLPLGSYGVFGLLFVSAGLMYYSGVLIFNLLQAFPKGTDLAGMATKVFGKWAGILVDLLFTLLLYCLLSMYLTGATSLITESGVWHNLGIGFWALFGLLFLVFGMRVQDLLNRWLMLFLVLSYLVFVGSASNYVTTGNLLGVPFTGFWPSLAVIATAFGYHVIIPSLRDYLGSEIKYYPKALMLGLLLPLVLYLVWCFSLYGLLPYSGKLGLLHLSGVKNSFFHISDYLVQILHNKLIPISLILFMFTSIISSYVGIAISLMQAVSSKCSYHRFIKALIVIAPPALFAVLVPGGFLIALHYAAIIVAVISLILPALMTIKARQCQTFKTKIGVIIILIYGAAVIYSSLL